MTISADRLVEFARRHVLRDDETIEWMKAVGDGTDTPVVDLSTAERGLSVEVVRGLLQAERASFVAAVVAVTREDEDFDGPAPREYLLMRHDGTAVRLADAGAVAALGERVLSGDLPPAAYAELLVHGQWRGSWPKEVVGDPVAWRRRYPAGAPLPDVEPLSVRLAGGTMTLTFAATQQVADLSGRFALYVSVWSVSVPPGAPATWQMRTVAESVPV
ncbi:hypothetical protein [Dactylosporangium sp. NPDC005555]|uniref:hypothetical protein n=1 Tax=Dactylosporangium sp. NPDC005555 TaxID=3154889 RepID=UPI0033BDB484